MSVILEQREDGLYYIGLTDGENKKFIFFTDTRPAADECAAELKAWLEGLARKKQLYRPWKLS